MELNHRHKDFQSFALPTELSSHLISDPSLLFYNINSCKENILNTVNPEKPLIRDLIIEGLSLARTQKEEFSSILNSNDGDINALFKTLEEFSKN